MPTTKYKTAEEKALAAKANSKRAYEKRKELIQEKNRERYRKAHPNFTPHKKYPFNAKPSEDSPSVTEVKEMFKFYEEFPQYADTHTNIENLSYQQRVEKYRDDVSYKKQLDEHFYPDGLSH